MSEKTFLVEIGTEDLASHTAPFNGLLLRVVWR